MGKPEPTLSAPVPSQGPGESSSGSNTSIPPQRLPDHNIPIPDPNDLPPLYSEIDNDVLLLDAPLLNQTQDSNPLDFDDGFTYPTGLRTINSSNLNACYLSSDLATDPVELQSFVTRLASHPPRPHIRILGTHDETEVRDGKKSTRVETDFDISIDLTPYLYAPDRQAWSELRTVENHESTRRGTVFASRAPGVQGDLELAGQAKPTLTEWCHRFCASHAGLKCFVLRRRVMGLDTHKIRHQLLTLIRSTNYRGQVTIEFPVKGEYVYIYNDCKVNRWRMKTWVQWLFYLSCLWIFTWPYLYFTTKVFEVVFVDWAFSRVDESGVVRYASVNEDQWYNLWGRAIYRAVIEQRQGKKGQLDERFRIESDSVRLDYDTEVLESQHGWGGPTVHRWNSSWRIDLEPRAPSFSR